MIDQFIQFAESWVSKEMWVGLIMFSVIAFVGTLIAIPAILIRLPPDYFKNHHHKPWFANHHPVIRTLGLRHVVLAGAGITDNAFRDSLYRLSRQASSGTTTDSASQSS
jgi:hypothetical protein